MNHAFLTVLEAEKSKATALAELVSAEGPPGFSRAAAQLPVCHMTLISPQLRPHDLV